MICYASLSSIFSSFFFLLWLLPLLMFLFFFFNDPAPPEIYPLPLPDALPIPRRLRHLRHRRGAPARLPGAHRQGEDGLLERPDGRVRAPAVRRGHAGDRGGHGRGGEARRDHGRRRRRLGGGRRGLRRQAHARLHRRRRRARVSRGETAPGRRRARGRVRRRSEEHTSELQSLAYLVCRLLLEKKKKET